MQYGILDTDEKNIKMITLYDHQIGWLRWIKGEWTVDFSPRGVPFFLPAGLIMYIADYINNHNGGPV